LALVLFGFGIATGGYLLYYLNNNAPIPTNWWFPFAAWLGMSLAAHIVVRRAAPYADPVLLPCVLLLNGLGLAMLNRLDSGIGSAAAVQLRWTALAIVVACVALVALRDYRVLERYTYSLFLLGAALLVLPLLPVIGQDKNGSQIWIEIFGYSFQPAEIAKIVLTFAFASYLSDHRERLKTAGTKVLGITWPRLADTLPIGVMWLSALAILVFQNDLGTSLLFFGLFVMMLYVATDSPAWPIIGGLAFAAAAVLVYTQTTRVQIRVESWLNPFADVDQNYQIIEGQFGMAWGGLFGRGWGMGRPGRIPIVNSDFISAAFGEELGLIGLMAIIILYAIIVMRSLRAALMAREWFGKLLASGLGFVFALQVFAIIGGVTRLLPLTGLTTPFISQGGSSLLANWVIIAILLRLSHQARAPIELDNAVEVVNLEDEETVALEVVAAAPASPRPAVPTAPTAAPQEAALEAPAATPRGANA
jgi:cell division protein FtsW (lipid II flippase)